MQIGDRGGKNLATNSRSGTYRSHCHHSGGISPPTSPECTDGVLPSTFTSRLSVNTVCDVVDSFDDYKRWLVNETGFGGTLHIPRQKKLNLKFSAWIMSKVDVIAREIDLGIDRKLRFWDADVHKVFGVPCGPRQVREPGKQLDTEAVTFIRNALGMVHADNAHSMKAAEAFLMKDISPTSSQMQQDCFKIAYIIFVVGHMLAPGNKHNYNSIDFWYAIGNAEVIPEFNWCAYILDELMKAVVKLKNDINNKCSTANLSGCHLFFQVFYLDNVDLGGLNKKHDTIPRFADFSYESMKKMIIMASSVGKAETSYTAAMLRPAALVGYTRVQHESPADAARTAPFMQQDKANHPLPIPKTPVSHPPTSVPLNTGKSATPQLGALDFCRHLTNAHPNLAAGGVALALKEYMARQVLNVTSMRNTQITDMMTFADKLFTKMAANCLCCTARGFDSCILTDGPNKKGGIQIQGRRLDLDAEQSGGIQSSGTNVRKRGAATDEPMERPQKFQTACGITTPETMATNTCTSSDQSRVRPQKHQHDFYEGSGNHHPPTDATVDQVTPTPFNPKYKAGGTTSQPIGGKKQAHPKCPLQELTSRAGDMAAAIRQLYEEEFCTPGLTIFGDVLSHNNEKVKLTGHCQWADHWFPAMDAFFELAARGYSTLWSYISRLPVETTSRAWIIHHYPRYINIPGIVIRKQLVGSHPLDHELCSAIIRRHNQIVINEANKRCTHPWSCSLEPDFAIAAIADMHCPTLAHIRNQFVNQDFDITGCWLFNAPVPLIDGWCNLAFDMTKKLIHIMDPTAGSCGLSLPRKKKLGFAADKVLNSLFDCINTFFTSWPVDQHGWKKKYPVLMDSHYSRDESGLCTTFFVKNFGGTDMKIAVSKDNLNNHRLMLLHQVMQMQGNSSELPHDHLAASKADAIVLDE